MTRTKSVAYTLFGVWVTTVGGFAPAPRAARHNSMRLNDRDSNSPSKAVVEGLTGFVNSLSSLLGTGGGSLDKILDERELPRKNPPRTQQELVDRLRDDYTQNNYLWTGDLDLDCFDPSCQFADPTISFQGTDKFMENTQNLVPLVEAVCENTESKLLDIQLYSDYVETRWNMVGDLKLFWKPKIDVIGKTKFWFRQEEPSKTSGRREAMLQIYSYDEEWEIPAYQALLQLISPANTFPNSTLSS